jgi:hypothetical protein
MMLVRHIYPKLNGVMVLIVVKVVILKAVKSQVTNATKYFE